MKTQKIFILGTILIITAQAGFCASFEGRLQNVIKLQDANSVTKRANGDSMSSPYMDMMTDPMINSMMQSGMNMLQNGNTGTFQQMEQTKQQMEFAKQQSQYIQQMDKED